METKNQIGLDSLKSKELSEKLNVLLANYHVFYMNVRGFHWNIKGEKFFELHLKFEELYNDLQLKIDEIAERILTLGEVPLHSFSDFLMYSKVKEARNLFDAKSTVLSVIEAFQTVLEMEREILKLSAETNDEGTNALMSDYIREKEKLIWMYKAYVS
ncbi:MAG: DNA starvation/stationary phase protection protein [Bacteroidales bacterium]|nr:DNA starvation/stationary phase protection protein [Bacteroidales bacterium]